MKLTHPLLRLLLVLASAWLITACGSGRHLQSITLAQTAVNNGEQVQFVATGTFSAPPTTITPLPVDWSNAFIAPWPPTYSYTLTTQPYVVNCTSVGPEVPQVVAFAPPSPSAPTSGTSKTVVTALATPSCLAGGQSAR